METIRRLKVSSVSQAVIVVAVVVMAVVALRDSTNSRATAERRADDAVAQSVCWQNQYTKGFGALSEGVMAAIDYIVEASQPAGNTRAVDIDGVRARLTAAEQAASSSGQICAPPAG